MSLKLKLSFFFGFLKKEKSFDVRFHTVNHFPKFQRKIFIIVDEKWVIIPHMIPILPKYHMPLKKFDSYETGIRSRDTIIFVTFLTTTSICLRRGMRRR